MARTRAANRRRLIGLAAATLFHSLLPGPAAGTARAQSAPDATARIGILGSADEGGFGRGARLGMDEAARSAGLLGRKLEIEWLAAPDSASAAGRARDLRERGFLAVVTALPGSAQSAFEEAAAGAGLLVVDARPAHPEGPARRGVFRVGLPETAYQAALTRSAGSNGSGDARAVLWDGALYRYGAQQLNDRFRRRFGEPMDGAAWAAWMAIKAIAETLLRAPGAGGTDLSAAMHGRRAVFDGHKGAPLAFRGPGRTLAQPFYIVRATEAEEVVWPLEDG
jgi:ABC-type branched-subunit amino acid transport system substrate-binding protein